ncbi:MAG: hypothetical protein WC568_06670 [Candidatus Methanoperedens sp.]
MKVKFLIQSKQKPDGNYELICHGRELSNFTIEAHTFQEGIDAIKPILNIFLKTQGQSWVERWKGSECAINCPESYIELPIDLWKCKLTKNTCNLQAQVFINDKELFMDGCHAPQERKGKIFKTIQLGQYDGFHHIQGRFLCVQCEIDKGKKRYEQYHYPWEMTSISECLAFSGFYKDEAMSDKILDREDSHTFEEELLAKGYRTLGEIMEKAGFARSGANCAICVSCCRKIISAIDPTIEKQLLLIELDFWGR